MNFCNFNKLEANAITVSDGVMNIEIASTEQFIDYKIYILDLCLALPDHAGTEIVTVTVGTNTYPILDRAGNRLRSGRLRGYHRYRIVFGTDPKHFLIFNGLCSMQSNAIVTKAE